MVLGNLSPSHTHLGLSTMIADTQTNTSYQHSNFLSDAVVVKVFLLPVTKCRFKLAYLTVEYSISMVI